MSQLVSDKHSQRSDWGPIIKKTSLLAWSDIPRIMNFCLQKTGMKKEFPWKIIAIFFLAFQHRSGEFLSKKILGCIRDCSSQNARVLLLLTKWCFTTSIGIQIFAALDRLR